jgi:hypothetical protein
MGIFFQKKDFCQSFDDGSFLLATDEVHTQPVSIKHFCLKNRFFASLKDTKGLAMINGAAMPPQIAVKPS